MDKLSQSIQHPPEWSIPSRADLLIKTQLSSSWTENWTIGDKKEPEMAIKKLSNAFLGTIYQVSDCHTPHKSYDCTKIQYTCNILAKGREKYCIHWTQLVFCKSNAYTVLYIFWKPIKNSIRWHFQFKIVQFWQNHPLIVHSLLKNTKGYI